MNALSNIHEERKQAHADLAIADEMRDLIRNYCGIIHSALMAKARDVSAGSVDEVEKEIGEWFGPEGAMSDAVVNITTNLRNRAIDLVGESIIRQRPKRHPAEHLPS